MALRDNSGKRVCYKMCLGRMGKIRCVWEGWEKGGSEKYIYIYLRKVWGQIYIYTYLIVECLS